MTYRFFNYRSGLLLGLYGIFKKLTVSPRSGTKDSQVVNNLSFGPQIDGCRNLDPSFVSTTGNTPERYEEWKTSLLKISDRKSNYVSLKFGDGDYYFLNQLEVGSATPGKRALSIPYSELDMTPFLLGANLVDEIACETVNDNLMKFAELFDERQPDYPAEFLYASVANRWLLKSLDGKLGLIGAAPKIDLIEQLLNHQIYRDFLGICEKVDLVRIPQKFACDDIEATRDFLAEQIATDSDRTYLMGVGHVKFGLTHLLKTYKFAKFIDIGSGIDALAGVIDVRRPYFADWVNFRFSKPEAYREIDLLQASDFGKTLFVP